MLSLAVLRTGTGAYLVDGGLVGAPIGTGVAGSPGRAGHLNLFFL